MFPLDAQSLSELVGGTNLIINWSLCVAVSALLFFSSLKFLLVLQQSGYRGKKYFKWLSSPETPYLKRLMLLCLMALLFSCILSITFAPLCGETASSYIGISAFILFTALYINTEHSINVKVPLKKTKRLVRLCITFIIVLLAFTYLYITLINVLAYAIGSTVFAIMRFALLSALPILLPFIMALAYWINEPIEELIKRSIERRTAEKLQKTTALKIAVTGSYGKTSVKEILKVILSQKFRVLSTPYSFNTAMGIALATEKLDNTYDIFIAEMGARYVGDIKKLADIVKPSIGVLTGINNQHYESFGSIENIAKTKNELFEFLEKNDGKGFFSIETEEGKKLFDKFGKEKYSVNGENGFVNATDVVTSEKGLSFTLNVQGEKSVKCSTVLLGSHNINNILLASAVAYELGLTVNEISQGISRIKSINHRLELVPNSRGIVIIDDSYNSNENGIVSAMETLDNFQGRKIVVTPGLVELGKMENISNLKFGKLLSKHADVVIVVGKHNAEMLINGLIEGGTPKDKIVFAKNLNKGNEILNGMLEKGDVVLFENDLPDNYN